MRLLSWSVLFSSSFAFAASQEDVACKRFIKDVQKLTHVDSQSEKFTDKKLAITALKKLDSHPPYSKGYVEILKKTVGKGDGFSMEDSARIWNSNPGCSPLLSHYTVLSRMLRAVETLDFTESEVAKLKNKTLQTVRQTVENPSTFIDIAISSALVSLLNDKNLIPFTDSQRQRLSSLTAEIEKTRNEIVATHKAEDLKFPDAKEAKKFAQLSPKLKEDWYRDIKRENAQVEPLRKQLHLLVSEIPS